MADRARNGASTAPASVPLGADFCRALGLRHGVDLVALDVQESGPTAVRLGEGTGRPSFVPVEVKEAGGTPRLALLRIRPLADAADFEDWVFEHRWLRGALTPLPASLRPLTGIEGDGARPAVLPPLLYCREKSTWIGAVCPDCDPSATGGVWCPRCGSRRPEGAAPVAPAALVERVGSRLAAKKKVPGGKGAKAVVWLPCATCPLAAECFPEGGAGKASARLVPVVENPWGGILVEPFDLPLRAWLRLASGERWSSVRAALDGWPPSHLRRLDDVFGWARPTLLGPEHGPLFALETLLLRLELLRQMLESLAALDQGPGRPHLGLGPDAVAIGLGRPGVLSSLLWTSRLRKLEVSRARWSGEEAVPPADRSPYLVPAECSQALPIPGRCHPRGALDPTGAKPWDFHFLPQHPSEDPPARGTLVRFGVDDGRGAATGPSVEGRVNFGFRDVWTVTVETPARFAAVLDDLLARDEGRPLIVVRAVLDHTLSDDLFAVGTMWLASLLVDPGALDLAAQLRDRLRTAGRVTPPKYAAAVRGIGYLGYRTDGDSPERLLPEDVLDAALEIGNRLCGGVAGAFAGQGHSPVPPGGRTAVYREMLAEVAAFARAVRNRLFGFTPADAEVRAALETLVREG
jgi:hypothetical protein